MVTSFDISFFYFDIVCSLLFLYAAWVNLVRKRISSFGADAFIFMLYSSVAREKVENMNLRENPRFISRMGLLMIILGFSFLNHTVQFLKIIWP